MGGRRNIPLDRSNNVIWIGRSFNELSAKLPAAAENAEFVNYFILFDCRAGGGARARARSIEKVIKRFSLNATRVVIYYTLHTRRVRLKRGGGEGSGRRYRRRYLNNKLPLLAV